MENERDQASDGSFLLPYSILPFNSISFNIIISSKLMTQTLTACLHFSKIKKERESGTEGKGRVNESKEEDNKPFFLSFLLSLAFSLCRSFRRLSFSLSLSSSFSFYPAAVSFLFL